MTDLVTEPKTDPSVGQDRKQNKINDSTALSSLPPAVSQIAELLAAGQSIAQIARHTRVEPARCSAVAARLRAMGIVAAPPAQFTEMEEEFFSAEVPPIDEADLPPDPLHHRLLRLVSRLTRR